MKKVLVWRSCLWFVFRSPKSGHFPKKKYSELVLKPFSDRNNSSEALGFGFSNSFP